MPKTKKTKRSAWWRLDLSNTKTRLLFVTAIFALFGGGLLVYRTFAARGYTTYDVARNNFKSVSNSAPEQGVGGKKDMKVMWVGQGGSMQVVVPGKPLEPRIPKGQQVRVCLHISDAANPSQPGRNLVITQKAENGREKTFHNVSLGPDFDRLSYREVQPIVDSYKKVCTFQRTWPNDTLQGPITIKNNGPGVRIALVGVLFREQGDPNTYPNQ